MRQARLPRLSREKALPDVARPESVFLSCGRPPDPATSPGDSPRPAGRSGPSAFQRMLLHEILCVSVKSEASVLLSPGGLPKQRPARPQSQMS